MKQVGSVGRFTILKPITATKTAMGIIIEGDITGKIGKGEVIAAGLDDQGDYYLEQGDIIFYLKGASYPVPGTDYVAIHDDNIIGYEYDDEDSEE